LWLTDDGRVLVERLIPDHDTFFVGASPAGTLPISDFCAISHG
jgi:hypothetical protein